MKVGNELRSTMRLPPVADGVQPAAVVNDDERPAVTVTDGERPAVVVRRRTVPRCPH